MKAHEIKILLVLSLGLLIGALNVGIFGPALPLIKNFFNVDERAIIWIINIYVLFYMVGAVFTSKMSDRVGKKNIHLINMLIFAIGTLAAILSSSFIILIISRVIQGFTAGGFFPISSAIIGDIFPQNRRGIALGIISAFFAFSFILGPILGGILLNFGWQWLFIINLPVILIIIPLGVSFLPETRKQNAGSFDALGIFLLGIVLALLTSGLLQIDTNQLVNSLESNYIWPLFLASFLILLFLWKTEKNATDPIIMAGIFKNKEITLTILISLLSGFLEISMVFIPSFAIILFNFNSYYASLTLIPVLIAIIVGSPLIGLSLDKFGSRKIVFTGGISYLIGLLILSFLNENLYLFFFANLMIGFGFITFIGAPLRYILLNEIREGYRTSGQALINISKGSGRLISGALFGAIIASKGGNIIGYPQAYAFISIISIIIITLALGLKKEVK